MSNDIPTSLLNDTANDNQLVQLADVMKLGELIGRHAAAMHAVQRPNLTPEERRRAEGEVYAAIEETEELIRAAGARLEQGQGTLAFEVRRAMAAALNDAEAHTASAVTLEELLGG